MTDSPNPIIHKPKMSEFTVKPNLEYDALRDNFSWPDIYDELDWLPGGWLNIAHEAIDRHANGRNRDKVAMIWEGKNGERETYTFGEMRDQSNKFANVLRSLGIGLGDSVFILLDRVPELYVAFFGILKVGAIAGPLFSSLEPELIQKRMKEIDTKVLVTQPELRRKITPIIPELFELQHIVVVNKFKRDPFPMDTADLSYEEEMDKATANHDIANTSQNDFAVMHYTSGTTGDPKGVLHQHQSVIQIHATGKWVLDFHDDDVYWCTADPGWITGTSYGMIAPWTSGITQFVYEGGFRASKWYEIIQVNKISVWYTSPTAIGMLMKADNYVPQHYDLSSLRFPASTGEPLDAEAVTWSNEVFGRPFHDNWLQTETGAILCANYASQDVRPGSIGSPIPGVEMGVVDEEYNPVPAGVEGQLVVRPGWPSMFRKYWNDTLMYNSRFRKGWYVTGDIARVDKDGYFWYAGRSEDDRPTHS